MTLDRKKPLRARPHSKGNRAEREIIDILKFNGYHGARRNFQSGGQGGGDITGGPADVHIEVKHHEICSIWQWLTQAEGEARPTQVASVWFRRNNPPFQSIPSGMWHACIPLDEYNNLLEDREIHGVAYETERACIWKWLDETPPGVKVTFKRGGSIWYVLVLLQEYLDLLRERDLNGSRI